jgi:hypothetical protein
MVEMTFVRAFLGSREAAFAGLGQFKPGLFSARRDYTLSSGTLVRELFVNLFSGFPGFSPPRCNFPEHAVFWV